MTLPQPVLWGPVGRQVPTSRSLATRGRTSKRPELCCRGLCPAHEGRHGYGNPAPGLSLTVLPSRLETVLLERDVHGGSQGTHQGAVLGLQTKRPTRFSPSGVALDNPGSGVDTRGESGVSRGSGGWETSPSRDGGGAVQGWSIPTRFVHPGLQFNT